MITVRSPHYQDVTNLVKLCRRLHEQSSWSWIPFSAAAMRKSILSMMRRNDYRVFIAERDGEMVGVLFGTVDAVLYGRTRYATDVEFAAEAGGSELIDAFKEWATQINAKVILMGDSNGGREPAKDRLFASKGLERVGGMYQVKL